MGLEAKFKGSNKTVRSALSLGSDVSILDGVTAWNVTEPDWLIGEDEREREMDRGSQGLKKVREGPEAFKRKGRLRKVHLQLRDT